jgi:gliding motility-associated-like protein
VLLQGDVSGGTPPYVYAWGGGMGSTSLLPVAPPVTQVYALQVWDLCGNLLSDSTTLIVAYDSVRVQVYPDTLICFGDTITVRALPAAGHGQIELLWNTGAITDSIRVSPPQLAHYWCVATDQCRIADSTYVTVRVERPIADFTVQGGLWEEDVPIRFEDLSTGPIIGWSWDFGAFGLVSSEQDPVVTYPGPGLHPVQLAIVDTLGCVDTLVRIVPVRPEFNLYLPSAFSPDGDGINEVFGVVGVGIQAFRLRIFDRWGQLVFESEDPAQGWDGTVKGHAPVPGVYPYVFRYLGPSGQTADQFGSVTLVR